MLGGDHDVSLLETIGAHKGVDARDLDVIEFLAGFLDHGLVGSSVNDENQCVIVFNGLDCALSAQRVLDDGVLVPGRLLLDASSGVLGLSGEGKGLGASESGVSPDLVLSDSVGTFLHGDGGCLRLGLNSKMLQEIILTPFFGIVSLLFNI